MIKLAVLVTGSPRFVNEGAEWWFKNAMPKDMEIDYYGHCWDNHDEIGSKRYYKADSKPIDKSYFKCWPFTDLKISNHTFDIDLYDSARQEDTLLSRFLLWEVRRDHIVSVAHATDLMLKSQKKYDVVLVMRFDSIIKPKSLDKVIPFVLNFYKHTTEFDKGLDKALYWPIDNPNIFTPWVQVRQGLPVMQDYMFLSKFDDWVKYTGGNLYEQYRRLLNEDKRFLEATNFVESTYHPHVFWAFIGMYSKANFIANNDLGCVALRSTKENISEISYDDIVAEHNKSFDDLCAQYIELGKIQGDI